LLKASPNPGTIGKMNSQKTNKKIGHFAHLKVARNPVDLRALGAPFICLYYDLITTISGHLCSVYSHG
jgi:hypothetical protein